MQSRRRQLTNPAYLMHSYDWCSLYPWIDGTNGLGSTNYWGPAVFCQMSVGQLSVRQLSKCLSDKTSRSSR